MHFCASRKRNRPVTVTSISAVARPRLFSATTRYFPAVSLLESSTSIVDRPASSVLTLTGPEDVRGLSFSSHETLGVGQPVTDACSFILVPPLIFCTSRYFDSRLIFGAPANRTGFHHIRDKGRPWVCVQNDMKSLGLSQKMCSSGINVEGELRRRPANPDSSGRMTVKMGRVRARDP